MRKASDHMQIPLAACDALDSRGGQKHNGSCLNKGWDKAWTYSQPCCLRTSTDLTFLAIAFCLPFTAFALHAATLSGSELKGGSFEEAGSGFWPGQSRCLLKAPARLASGGGWPSALEQ